MPGTAPVYRVDPDTMQAQVVATGFTNIIDMAFETDGTLYVMEMAKNGLLDPMSGGTIRRVNSDFSHEVVVDGLTFPGGFTIKDGKFYVRATAQRRRRRREDEKK